MTIYDRIKYLREKADMSQQELAEKVGFKTASAVNKIELGLRDINQTKIRAFAKALKTTPSYLLGDEENIKLHEPEITENVIEFPVIGDVAAGFEKIATEDWDGDKVHIPVSYLKGRKREEYFVLQIKGDSMYPMFISGDKVLILKQNALDNNGQVAVVLYNDECGTIKKIEYKNDSVHLVPINPLYQPEIISGADLESFRILGIPKLLIREIEE